MTVRLEAAICILCKCNPLPFSRVDENQKCWELRNSDGTHGRSLWKMEMRSLHRAEKNVNIACYVIQFCGVTGVTTVFREFADFHVFFHLHR